METAECDMTIEEAIGGHIADTGRPFHGVPEETVQKAVQFLERNHARAASGDAQHQSFTVSASHCAMHVVEVSIGGEGQAGVHCKRSTATVQYTAQQKVHYHTQHRAWYGERWKTFHDPYMENRGLTTEETETLQQAALSALRQ